MADRKLVDVMAHEMYVEWRAGASFTVGASLVEHLLKMLKRTWPKDRWILSDVLRDSFVFSDDMDSISNQWLLIGEAKTIARYDQNLALFLGKATHHFDDPTVSSPSRTIATTEQIQLMG